MMTSKAIFAFMMMILLAGCGANNSDSAVGMTTYTIGSVLPLTGDGAVYGLPTQKVIQQAVDDLNKEWASENKKLEILFEDGKCNPRDSLSATQNLVNVKGIKVMVGYACSGEGLGSASFNDQNKIAALSPLTSSPDITKAGDYYFRNYPSDTGQVAVLAKYLAGKQYKKVAILSEGTDYAQALRKGYIAALEAKGTQIVVDEIIQPNTKDVRTELLKAKDAKPDAVIFLPQTIPMAAVMGKQLSEFELDADLYGNEVFVLPDAIKDMPPSVNGLIAPILKFEETAAFEDLKAKTGCDLAAYCVTSYDAVFLMGEVLKTCGDQDSDCVKDALYNTQGWNGPIGGPYSFDENGDVPGDFELFEVQDGKTVKIQG